MYLYVLILEVFVENVKEVEAHNNQIPETKWKKGINAYSDLTGNF